MASHITIRKAPGTWTVRAGGAVLGETNNALELVEGEMAPVIYFPRDDVRMDLLEPTDTVTHCPFRGNANYWSLRTSERMVDDAAWSYESPKDDVAAIAEHLAFYTSDKVAIEEI